MNHTDGSVVLFLPRSRCRHNAARRLATDVWFIFASPRCRRWPEKLYTRRLLLRLKLGVGGVICAPSLRLFRSSGLNGSWRVISCPIEQRQRRRAAGGRRIYSIVSDQPASQSLASWRTGSAEKRLSACWLTGGLAERRELAARTTQTQRLARRYCCCCWLAQT